MTLRTAKSETLLIFPAFRGAEDGDEGGHCRQSVNDEKGDHAAMPERDKNSVCQTANGTSPAVPCSISRAVSASGNRLPFLYLLIAACDRPTLAASALSAFSSRRRKSARRVL